jgi:tRNA threonylcarbamoyladenosine biosynthesis protein TsaE
MATLISHSPEETQAIGEAWGRVAQRGWIIGLSGDLGAGKTQLVKGLALGLGVSARVHSPTFTLLNQYDGGRLPLYHIDLYRLETTGQILGAGLEPYLFDPDGVTVVEWAERWPWEMRNESAVVRLAKLEVISETERRITYEDSGA